MPRVLLIEDDAGVRTAMHRHLTERGFAVTSAATGLAGLAAVTGQRPDLILLDLGLPDVEGIDVLRMIRAVSRAPVLVATARDEEAGIVLALDLGADDYLVKPFGPAHLAARVNALLRRAASPARAAVIEVGGLVIDPAARIARLDGTPLDLAPREFDMLAYLAGRSGEVIAKRELLAEVWQHSYGGAEKTVDVHLSWLRRKLGESATRPRYLHTVHGVGIRLAAPR
ncbi:response regulator transcription factor [Actinoplanes sp. GCM10030250]|uniref:response regulator transcription factor n=1 Tax=Actinoplanes sp. GCM10030250 TaxID=3273376 RepID=UPI00361B6FBC